MVCPGSVELVRELNLPESDEAEWQAEGIAAHALAAFCLEYNREPWESLGETLGGTTVAINEEMVHAVDTYLSVCRPFMLDKARYRCHVEQRIQLPGHDDGFGTLDFSAYDLVEHRLHLFDLKYGVGVFVEVEGNSQINYYAAGELQHYPECREVILGIVQPRIVYAAPIRTYTASPESILQWMDDVLIPAMHRTAIDLSLWPGEHCRFCPAKIGCPTLSGMFAAAATADVGHVIHLTDAQLAREWNLVVAVKKYISTIETEAFKRLSRGTLIDGLKLVHKKANRVFKPEAETVLLARLGDVIYSKPELQSPATIEKISAEAGELVKEWAFTPESDLTVAASSDKRPAIKAPTLAETFAHAVGTE